MKRSLSLVAMVALLSCGEASAQIKRTETPVGDGVSKALDKGALTFGSSQPFHILVKISEPENPQSPYWGSIEEWWSSPDRFRREVTVKGGMRQTIVVSDGKKTERDEGDYFPRWFRSFVDAVFDPIPNAQAWEKTGLMIEQVTLPNGDRSDACVRGESKIGQGDRATNAYSNVCFDGQGRLKFYGSPSYSMEFSNFRGFGKKQIPRTFTDHPEPGTQIVGEVERLEDLHLDKVGDLFAPLPTNDDRFRSAAVNAEQMDRLSAGNPPIVWPTVHSGNLHGHLAVYLSVDSTGKVQEAWPLNSDNAGLEDSVREQLRHWTMKPATDATGARVQVEGGIGFVFDTKIEAPLPELQDAEIRALATQIVEPVWAAGTLTPGQVIEVEVAIDQQGKLAGMGFTKVPGPAQGPVMNALNQWTFRPLIRNGQPQYFHSKLRFTVP